MSKKKSKINLSKKIARNHKDVVHLIDNFVTQDKINEKNTEVDDGLSFMIREDEGETELAIDDA